MPAAETIPAPVQDDEDDDEQRGLAAQPIRVSTEQPRGNTSAEHTNPAMLHDLATKFREAGGWPKDVPPIEIRLDAEGNVIEANGRHRVTVARAVLGPNARIPVKIVRNPI